jgi:diguanylate cyclase
MNASADTPGERLAASLALADPEGRTLPEAACAAARQAMGLARDLGDPLSEARAGAWLGEQLLRLGRHAEVLTEAPPVLLALSRMPAAQALAPERLLLMRAFTMAACELGDFDRALDTAHEMVRVVGPLGDATAALKASFTLGVCFERIGDSWQASRVLGEALRVHGPSGDMTQQAVMQNALCAISIGLFHRLNGPAPQAEVEAVLARAQEAGQKAVQTLPARPDPFYETATRGNLGEVLMYQGSMPEAQALLLRARASAVAGGLRAYRWRLDATLAVFELLTGHPENCLVRVQELLSEMGAQAPQQTAIRAHHAAYQACRAMGRFEAALQHFEHVEGLERGRATQQLRAQSQLFVTRTEAQQAQWQASQARQEAQAQRARAAEFAARAERDPLTGLGNRRHFDRRCAELLPVLQSDGEALALVLIDLDHFKKVNDTHGHDIGDEVLVTLAALLRENTRARDVVARYGGEEFVIVLPSMGPESAREVCERLRERVAAHTGFSAAVPELRVTLSMGLACAPPYDIASLLKAADLALYAAKREGRNRLNVAQMAAVPQVQAAPPVGPIAALPRAVASGSDDAAVGKPDRDSR